MAIESTGLPSASINSSSSTSNKNADSALTALTSSKESQTNNVNAQSGKAAGNTSNADSVTLTKDAMKLSMIQADIKNQPDMDTERVDQLKAAIESGEYNFNPTRVAEKFLQFESQL